MGFLNKNAVAARQLPALTHQRIFAVSAYLHGIMDTALKGKIPDCTGCVGLVGCTRGSPEFHQMIMRLAVSGPYDVTPHGAS